VIERIADHPITQIDQLLPWNVPSLIRLDFRWSCLSPRGVLQNYVL
jgi:hypothetical protein